MSHLNADSAGSPFSQEKIRDPLYFESLRTRLRWQLLLAYITPLLVLSAFFYYQYDAIRRQGIRAHLRAVAENKRNTVSLFLQERVANLKSAFSFPVVPPAEPEMALALAKLRRESETFVDVGLFDPGGVLTRYSGPFPDLRGKSYSAERWFQNLLGAGRETYISDVYLGFRHRPHFIIAVRREIAGRVWVLRASVDPQRFSRFVGRSMLVADMESFIINAKGERQTAPRGGEPYGREEPAPAHSQETEVQEVAAGGGRYLRAVAWLSEADWALVVRIPNPIAFAPVRRARIVLGAGLAVTLGLIVLLVLQRTRRIISLLQEADRSKEDMRRQLFNAAKLASVGEIAAGVAHEINNPLAIIYEEAGMMKDILDPAFRQELDLDDFRERLGAIMESTMRGRSITGKLLAFARQYDGELEASAVNPLVERALAMKAAEFKVSNVQVQVRLAEGLPPVLVNRNQMDQVLFNLLNNARDAVGEAGKVEVRTYLDAGMVCIDLRDDGCGMSPEQMEKIFFPFYTTKGVGKGTGLGLSISYGIVKSMGGRIEVDSAPGEGTCVTIMLPPHDAVASPRRRG